MHGEARRELIKKILSEAEQPTAGSDLARRLSVSRQVIVQDISLLRAKGEQILATPQGYLMLNVLTGSVLTRTFATQHDTAGMEEELKIIVDAGGRVVDVIVEHPLYGELRGLLMLSSRLDVENFVANLQSSKAKPLSVLTNGVHLHTVEAVSEEVFSRIEQELAQAGILLQ
ncbi:MAG: transcription repressor NadR [Bacillota bacterium]